MSSLTRTVASDTPEPVTLDEFKLHIRDDYDVDDVAHLGRIMAARQALEIEYSTALVPTTCVLRLDRFPYGSCYGDIELRVAHVTSVTSIQYVDANGTTQTLSGASYVLDQYSTPARVRPAFGTSWPSTRDVPNAVIVTFVAGYATPDVVPFCTKAALMLLAAELSDKREPTMVGAAIAKIPGFDALMIAEDWGAVRGLHELSA